MNDLLTDLMHERADALPAPELDLGTIHDAGNRRVRGRRTRLAGAAVAAAAALTLGGTTLLGDGPGDGLDAATEVGDAPDPLPLSWVTGSTLHRQGAPDVDLGAEVRAWVRAGDQVVFTDLDGLVRQWGPGGSTVIGEASSPGADRAELVADGPSVAWVDGSSGFVVHDVATGSSSSTPVEPGQDEPAVTAIDGDVVYVVDSRGVAAWRTTDGRVDVLDPDPGAEVMDAESGVLVRSLPRENRALLTREGRTIELSTREFARLSPDGRLVAIENNDVGVVVDAVTGERLPFRHGHEWAVGYEWLDDTTLAVMAFDGLEEDGAAEAVLTSCDAVSGTCEQPGRSVPSGFGDFQLPIGVRFSE